jgi:uncharacterized membrane protein YeaQ/YmgE (transglycosylase-associated protein family)
MNPASDAVVSALTGLAIAAVIGLAIGVIARLLVVGRHPAGWGATLLLGIAGAWIGSFLLAAVGMGRTLPGLAGAMLGAMLGATLLLAAFLPLRRGRRPLRAAEASGRLPAAVLEQPAPAAR